MLIKYFVASVFLGSVLASGTARADGDFTIGPDYIDAPELTVREGVPKGIVHAFILKSEDSKIYTGLTGPYELGVWVYVPSQYVPGTPSPFISVLAGRG